MPNVAKKKFPYELVDLAALRRVAASGWRPVAALVAIGFVFTSAASATAAGETLSDAAMIVMPLVLVPAACVLRSSFSTLVDVPRRPSWDR